MAQPLLTMTQTLSVLHADWFDALYYAAPFLRGQTRTIALETELRLGDPASPWIGRWEIIKPGGAVPNTLRLYVNIRSDLPRIERIEMNLTLVSLAAWYLRWGTFGDASEERLALCKQLGCWPEVLNVPATRWRLLHASRDLATLPYADLESRKRCVICPGRIATGASAAEEYPEDRAASVRFDLHGTCWKYLHHTLAPQLRAARAERAAQAPNKTLTFHDI